MATHKKINKDFFKKWTSEMAYVLGFFAADGYITVNRRGGQYWCFQIIDKELLEQIKKSIKADHKISVRPASGNNQTIYRLQIGSIEMCDDLRKLGFNERKTKCLVLPNIPDKYFADFLRGYFDGDGNVWMGYVHKERIKKLLVLRTIFTSCSGDFLSTLRQRLEGKNIANGVLREGNGNYYRLVYSIHSSLKLYDFMYNGGVRTNRMIFLNRKRIVFEKFIKMRP